MPTRCVVSACAFVRATCRLISYSCAFPLRVVLALCTLYPPLCAVLETIGVQLVTACVGLSSADGNNMASPAEVAVNIEIVVRAMVYCNTLYIVALPLACKAWRMLYFPQPPSTT